MSAPGPHAPAACALAGTLLLCAAVPAGAGELQVKPTLTLSEEYNDNILETATDRHSDFVTRVRPGAALSYRAPRFTNEIAYSFDYRNYAKGTRTDEQVHTLSLLSSTALTEKRLFLDLRDTLSRVSLSVARDVTSESLFLNQADQNVALVSPYLLWRPGEKALLKTGYRFSDTRYWSSSGIDKRQHQGYAEYLVELAPRLSMNASYSYARVHTDIIFYEQHDVSGGFSYEYADNSFIYGSLGNSWQSFERLKSASSLFWNGGVSRDWRRVVASASTQVQYAEDPLAISTRQTNYTARLEFPREHGNLSFTGSYNKYQGTFRGLADRTSLIFTGSGRWELSERLTANLALAWDRVRGASTEGYPYHLTGTAGLGYRFNYDISANLSYGYVEYRRRFDSATDMRQTNRVVLEATKVF